MLKVEFVLEVWSCIKEIEVVLRGIYICFKLKLDFEIKDGKRNVIVFNGFWRINI